MRSSGAHRAPRHTLLARCVGVLVAGLVLVPASPARAAREAAARCSTGRARAVTVVYRAPTDPSNSSVTLTDMTTTWGLEGLLRGMLVHTIAAADVNRDGWTDLFVGTFADRKLADYQVRGATAPAPDRLLLGGPTGFTLDPTFPGRLGRTSGAAFADLDGDGWPELVIARNVRDVERGRSPSEILRNREGTFEPAVTLREPGGARSVGLLDYDSDGRLDLFVTEDRWTGGSSRLLRNEGALQFRDVTREADLPLDVVGMGVGTADFNRDGATDLFVGGSNRVFLGNRTGHFHEGSSRTFGWRTFGDEDDPAGVAIGDLNRDGLVDIVVGQHYGSTIDAGRRVPVRLYLNQGNDADGDPRFGDVTDEAGLVGLSTKAPHVEVADLDADGWPDIVTTASVDDTTPMVFQNLGMDGPIPHFRTNGESTSTQYWPSGAVLDADHDGRLDLVLAEFDDRRPTLALRNVTESGHWLAVAASPTAGSRSSAAVRSGTSADGSATCRSRPRAASAPGRPPWPGSGWEPRSPSTFASRWPTVS